MPVFDDEQDEIAFLERNPERGIAIVLPTVIENHLTSILKAAMRPNTAISNDLFSPRGAFGNFGTKIRLSYMLELIRKLPRQVDSCEVEFNAASKRSW
jgi:hypothetical protein